MDRLTLSVLTSLWILAIPARALVRIDGFDEPLPFPGTLTSDADGSTTLSQTGLSFVRGGTRQITVSSNLGLVQSTRAEIKLGSFPPPVTQVIEVQTPSLGGALELVYSPVTRIGEFTLPFDMTLAVPAGGPPARLVVKAMVSREGATLRVQVRDTGNAVAASQQAMVAFSGPGEHPYVFSVDPVTFPGVNLSAIDRIEVRLSAPTLATGSHQISDISVLREDIALAPRASFSLPAPVSIDSSFFVLDRPPLPDVEPHHPLSGGDDFAADLGADCSDLSCLTPLEGEPVLASASPLALSWEATAIANYPLDPQVAASSTHLIVTTTGGSGRIAFYEKNGALLTQTPDAQPLKNPMYEAEFFAPLLPHVNSNLALPPSVASQLDGNGDPLFAIDTVFDTRAVFSAIHRRFFVVAIARNSAPRDPEIADTFEEYASRRTKLVVAVSRSEDPREGWHYYWWNAVISDGACYDQSSLCGCPGTIYQPGDFADYPSVGVSRDLLVINTQTFNKSPIRCTQGEWRYTLLHVSDVHDMLAGLSSVDGVQIWEPTYSDSTVASGVLQPAVHHDVPSSGLHYLASTRSDDTLVIWGLTPISGGSTQLFHREIPVSRFYGPSADPDGWAYPQLAGPGIGVPRPINAGSNLGNSVLKAVSRADRLYATWEDCKQWPGASQCIPSIRLSRVDVSGFPFSVSTGPGSGFIDRTFGKRNPADPAGAINAYSWPAVDVNDDGDMVLNYARTGSGIFPEARFSVYHGDGTDIRPSYLLHAGIYTLGKEMQPGDKPAGRLDLTGSAVDPFDPAAVWIAQPYSDLAAAGEGQYRLVIGKVFGSLFPDLTAQVTLQGATVRAPGENIELQVKVRNQGDGPAPASELRLYLSADAEITEGDLLLGTLQIPALAAGTQHSATEQLPLPLDVDSGNYHLGGIINPEILIQEYSEANNASSPLLGAPLLQVAASDMDGDGFSNAVDNCPFFANPDQLDSDSNGRGNLCECGDQNGDGMVSVPDLVAINRAIFDPSLVTPLCDTNNDAACNVSDIVGANLEIFSPGNTSTCARQPVPGP